MREPRIEPARRGRCLITEKSQGLCEVENFGCQRHVLRRQDHGLNTILKNQKLREATFFTAREVIYILSLIMMKVEIAEEENIFLSSHVKYSATCGLFISTYSFYSSSVRDQYFPFQLGLAIAEPSRKIKAGSGG